MKKTCACGHNHHDHDHHDRDCCHEHRHDHPYSCGHDHHHDHDDGCGCSHEHGEHAGQKLALRSLLTIALLAAGHFAPLAWLGTLLSVAAYLSAGYDVLLTAGRNILRGRVFDENFLMAAASLGAMAIGEAAEGVMVMLLYQLGEYLQHKAADTSRQNIAVLMDVRPDFARLPDGREVSPEAVHVGDLIQVRPGERIPLDGMVVSGVSGLDTAALTGESLPRQVAAGDTALSGCVNLTGVLTVRVTAEYAQSTAAKILALLEDSAKAKASAERFITRFSRWYTPVVCGLAVLIALVPGLSTGDWRDWFYTALTFLVISCPCALVISVPLTFFSGIGGATRLGVLIKGANHLETLAAIDTIAFDKTGTLTRGVFEVTRVCPVSMTEEALLDLAAHAEIHSAHPISRSLQAAAGHPLDETRVTDVAESIGRGLSAMVDGQRVLCGNEQMMLAHGIQPAPVDAVGTVVHVAAADRYAGYILISDVVKPGAAQALKELKTAGIRRLVMLTGDNETVAADVAQQVGLTDYRASLLPADKVKALEALLEEGKTAFAGDGVNDAPVLRRADAGIAMGGLGSDAAIEAADIVLMDDDLGKLARAIRQARKTLRIARQNIVFALAVKIGVMLLGVLGAANMWLAVFADVGVAMLCILNALRASSRIR